MEPGRKPGTATRLFPPGRVQRRRHSSRRRPYPGTRARGREAACVGSRCRVRRGGARLRRRALAGAARSPGTARLPAVLHRGAGGGGRSGEPAADFAREREGLGLAPAEVAAELLVLGRVLERHGEATARAAVDRCLVGYVERLAAEPSRRCGAAIRLTGLLTSHAFHAELSLEVARARRYRGGRRARALRGRLLRGSQTTAAVSDGERCALRRPGGNACGRPTRPPGSAATSSPHSCRRPIWPTRTPSWRGSDGQLSEGLSVSVGAACFPAECATVEQLLEKAERRLYSDKAARAA